MGTEMEIVFCKDDEVLFRYLFTLNQEGDAAIAVGDAMRILRQWEPPVLVYNDESINFRFRRASA